ncbi:MAG TPA: hypothetical protein VFX61_14835 [Micromonosporaceae bacterium]|nr:hypothetical protein [Micromonosporaceae bacterium]
MSGQGTAEGPPAGSGGTGGGTGSGGSRLDRIRGAVAPLRHNARTIAALTGNPGCARRAVLDGAGVDKQRLASQVGFPARFGQSRFAITRGNLFEAQVKANGCAELLRLLRERLKLPIPEVAYADLGAADQEPAEGTTQPPAGPGDVGARVDSSARHVRSRQLLGRAAAHADRAATLFDHPLLRLEVAGQRVYLEPDLIAFQLAGRFHVIEIKSFPVIDGQADPGKVSAAALQSAVYVLAMRELLAELGHDPELVSHEVVLVCPKDFTNQPVASLVDVRQQLSVLRRQLSRLARIDDLVVGLPAELTFDPRLDPAGAPTAEPAALVAALSALAARYAPDCLAMCELAYFCRDEARGTTAALGRTVREALGGVETVAEVLGLAAGTLPPAEEQAEAAALLRSAARLRTEVLS